MQKYKETVFRVSDFTKIAQAVYPPGPSVPPADYQSREVAPLKCRLDLEVPAAQLPILSVEILAL